MYKNLDEIIKKMQENAAKFGNEVSENPDKIVDDIINKLFAIFENVSSHDITKIVEVVNKIAWEKLLEAQSIASDKFEKSKQDVNDFKDLFRKFGE